ncbi:MAG: EcoAI/FtnUII family type I restriction enzme subunit R [Candidatus Saccharimonadia bacterium]
MSRNETTTRSELIDPMLVSCGWGINVTQNSQILYEYKITDGQLLGGGQRSTPQFADYVLAFNNQKLAIIEAKRESEEVTEGLEQVKEYARKLQIRFVYSTNGHGIYCFDTQEGRGYEADRYPAPDELYNMVFGSQEAVAQRVLNTPFHREKYGPRYYQENAINAALASITRGEDRALLTLATGTGKTFIAFQVVWKLFQARWNKRGNELRPRILFLADRNTLVEQAMNDFNPLESEIKRINGEAIRKGGKIPTSGNVFFSIYQAMTGGPEDNPYYKDYPKDFFDLIIIDECHRGAGEDSNWRAVLDHFSGATHLGLTATPKRADNTDTYNYFGKPKYVYSLQEGIKDGFLTPFKVKRIETTLNEYRYTADDEIVSGEVSKDVYTKSDFNRIIRIKQREEHLVKIMLQEINNDQKTIVFCANEAHALLVRDLINKYKTNSHQNYCVRVTSKEGKLGDEFLKAFRDNEKTIPTILTTSQKLSTGVDARNVRYVVLMRGVGSLIEFKQIVGRGTRVFEGKDFFTIVDFNDNIQHFSDPEWDGVPLDDIEINDPTIIDIEAGIEDSGEAEVTDKESTEPLYDIDSGTDGKDDKPGKLEVRLPDGTVRRISHTVETIYFGNNGKAMSPREFLEEVFGSLPQYFNNEDELRKIWSNPATRERLLKELANNGFNEEKLSTLRNVIDANDSDMYDVLRYVAFAKEALSRSYRAEHINSSFYRELSEDEESFIKFVLDKYTLSGERELSEDNLSKILELKYHSLNDAVSVLGDAKKIKNGYVDLQRELYAVESA